MFLGFTIVTLIFERICLLEKLLDESEIFSTITSLVDARGYVIQQNIKNFIVVLHDSSRVVGLAKDIEGLCESFPYIFTLLVKQSFQ